MRYILFSIQLLVASCSYGQAKEEQQAFIQMDSIVDVDKMPINAEFANVFRNSLLLKGHLYELTLQDNRFEVASDTSLFTTFNTANKIISRSTFYFFYDSAASVDTVNDIIAHLKLSNSIHFKVGKLENLMQRFNAAQATSSALINPVITTSNAKQIDSSYFVIDVLKKDSYSISFLNKHTAIKGSAVLDKFIQQKRSLIKYGKIAVRGNANEDYKKMKPVLDILKKNKYYKFQLLTTSEAPPQKTELYKQYENGIKQENK